MKISILQGAFLPVPPKRGGAVEKVWLGLGREFARRGHEVCHVSRLSDGLPLEEVIDGVRHRRVRGYDAPASLMRLKWRDYLYTRRALRLLPRADVVVTNTFWAPMLLNPARHGAIWVHVQRYPKGQMRFYRRAACLQTVSTVIAEAIIRQAPQCAGRVRVIPNPCPPLVMPSPPVGKDPALVLFVGRVHPEKGLELLIRAMGILRQQHPEARLRVVGPWETSQGGGGSEFLLKLRALADEAGGAVEFTGPVFNEAALAAHYEEAAVFVYPSLAATGEASPVAPLEALGHGLPVVVSDLACFNDLLGVGTYARRFNHRAAAAPARLAGVLEAILLDPSRGPDIALAGRARAGEFSMGKIADRYLDEFEQVLAARAGR